MPTTLPVARDTDLVRADGRPSPALREQLRRIPSWRNAGSVVSLYIQTAAVIWISMRYPWTLPLTFLLMGRAFAQFASLMHEAAHRLLFADKRANDWVGRWVLGYPAFTSTDAYRRVHMAH
ncbi:MAG: fatty acid desaturase, partial [Ilumatobacteraceae bacterium]